MGNPLVRICGCNVKTFIVVSPIYINCGNVIFSVISIPDFLSCPISGPDNSLYSVIIYKFFEILDQYVYPNYNMFNEYTNDDIANLTRRIYTNIHFINTISNAEYNNLINVYNLLDKRVYTVKFLQQLILSINFDNDIAKNLKIYTLTQILGSYYRQRTATPIVNIYRFMTYGNSSDEEEIEYIEEIVDRQRELTPDVPLSDENSEENQSTPISDIDYTDNDVFNE